MTQEAKHTPTPWKMQDMGSQETDIIANSGTIMGLTGGSGAPSKYEPDDAAEWDANAAFILKAVNCHDDLLSALKGLVYALGNPIMGAMYEIDRNLPDARAAIAKATQS